MTGQQQIDALVFGIVRGLPSGDWITTRTLAERTMLALETCGFSIGRLLEGGQIEANTDRPRGYRALPFPIELPAGFRIDRSGSEHIVAPYFYPDGAAVQIWVVDDRMVDGGNAALRMPLGADALRAIAEERELGFDGEALFGAVEAGVLERLAKASSDAVWQWPER